MAPSFYYSSIRAARLANDNEETQPDTKQDWNFLDFWPHHCHCTSHCPYQCFLIWIYIFAIAFFVHSPTIVVSQKKLNQSYRLEKLIKNVVAKIKAKIERQGRPARDKCKVKEDDGCEHSTKWCVHCAQAAQLWVTALVTKLSHYDGHDLQGELKEHR